MKRKGGLAVAPMPQIVPTAEEERQAEIDAQYGPETEHDVKISHEIQHIKFQVLGGPTSSALLEGRRYSLSGIPVVEHEYAFRSESKKSAQTAIRRNLWNLGRFGVRFKD